MRLSLLSAIVVSAEQRTFDECKKIGVSPTAKTEPLIPLKPEDAASTSSSLLGALSNEDCRLQCAQRRAIGCSHFSLLSDSESGVQQCKFYETSGDGQGARDISATEYLWSLSCADNNAAGECTDCGQLQYCDGGECKCADGMMSYDGKTCVKEVCADPAVTKTTCDPIEVCANGEGFTTTNTCKCKAGFKESTPGSGTCEIDDFPCPSGKCWDWDPETKDCTMRASCSILSCTSTEIVINFSNDLFATGTNAEDLWTSEAKPVFDLNTGRYDLSVPLGEKGMTYEIDESEEQIIFKLPVTLGGATRQRRDVAPPVVSNDPSIVDGLHRRINLGALAVETTPFGVGVSYQCSYPLKVSISVNTPVATLRNFGSRIGLGSLADGFDMKLYGQQNAEGMFIMGTGLTIEVSWTITALPELTFYYEECGVAHGHVDIDIVKGGCYSELTSSVPFIQDGSLASFEFQVFKAYKVDSKQQAITCSMMLCRRGECKQPTEDEDCPQEAADAVFKYKSSSESEEGERIRSDLQ